MLHCVSLIIKLFSNENNPNVMIFIIEKSAPPRAALAREVVLVALEFAASWQCPVEDPLLTITATLSRVQLPQ